MIAKKLLNNIQKRGIYVVRQSQYVGQTPVQIVNNTISLETSFIDKVNTIDNLQRDITTNTNSITTINNSINGISTQLTTLNNSINTTNNNVSTNTQKIETNKQNITTNTQQIEAVKTKAEANTNSINTLNTNVANKLDTATFNSEKANFAKTNVENTFNANQNINGTGDILTLKRTNNSSFGMDLLAENNDRLGYFGTRQNGVNEATVWGKNGLLLQATNGKVWVGTSGNDFQWESSRNWSQNVDNSVVRTKDLKFVRIFEKTNQIPQPTTNWQTNLQWTIDGINNDGMHEVFIVVSINDVAFSLNTKIVWKSGLSESKSQFLTISDGGNEYMFQLVIWTNNVFKIYHKKTGGSNNIQWIRGWIIRGRGLPWKANQLW